MTIVFQPTFCDPQQKYWGHNVLLLYISMVAPPIIKVVILSYIFEIFYILSVTSEGKKSQKNSPSKSPPPLTRWSRQGSGRTSSCIVWPPGTRPAVMNKWFLGQTGQTAYVTLYTKSSLNLYLQDVDIFDIAYN